MYWRRFSIAPAASVYICVVPTSATRRDTVVLLDGLERPDQENIEPISAANAKVSR